MSLFPDFFLIDDFSFFLFHKRVDEGSHLSRSWLFFLKFQVSSCLLLEFFHKCFHIYSSTGEMVEMESVFCIC